MMPSDFINPLFISDVSPKNYKYELVITPFERDTIHSALKYYYNVIKNMDTSISINMKESKDVELWRVEELSKAFDFNDIGER